MGISARIIADSVNPYGSRLTTFVVRANRWILAEINTHRMLSRNAASSRAIPIAKMLEAVQSDPASPEWWGQSQAGMQADQEVSPESIAYARGVWRSALDSACRAVIALESHKIHKQVTNRLLEPWAHVTCLISATEWSNFFQLRAHPAAQPEFQVLAYRMLDVYLRSTPKLVPFGEWHIPFGDQMPDLPLATQLKIAAARAARVSYLTHDGNSSVAGDVALFDRLVADGHHSPLEHQAQSYDCDFEDRAPSNFLSGWHQHRKLYEQDRHDDLRCILDNKPEWISLDVPEVGR